MSTVAPRRPHPWVLRWAGLLTRGRHAGDTSLACSDEALARLPLALDLRSTGFAHGGAMARRHAGEGVGDNRSPALAWNALPPQATHWLLLCEDPDVPMARAITHLLAWGPRAIDALAEGALNAGHAPTGVALVLNGLGRSGYDGPRPLPGHGPHRYVFQLYALDAAPPAGLSRETTLLPWLRTHALSRGRLDGLFRRDWRQRPIAP
ncbi:YbhB/YbcL family Raf kinase inhibitor-like protein [Variovorax sp. PAMC26660]|uniref:YbhB/YbcL family Raf kinase inhibitor-like protein n=1 Tax=Variovorax sp. PAMC26660 TaxID=2762322 RepID=UPI00164D90D5|nr:YbhB/YbcL family Raf kinase inhibitor-like protein [Variovorax sp. PAMC26660]QNK65080.1 YbhB/YbcL family Raf kinase inhibitor-like protein [Variovorax sp. PAMC26660]